MYMKPLKITIMHRHYLSLSSQVLPVLMLYSVLFYYTNVRHGPLHQWNGQNWNHSMCISNDTLWTSYGRTLYPTLTSVKPTSHVSMPSETIRSYCQISILLQKLFFFQPVLSVKRFLLLLSGKHLKVNLQQLI